jgi:acylglycerol lipase
MTHIQVQNAREERLDVGGGIRIFVRSWRPETGASGVVVIVPGFNSHSGYYGWSAEHLVARGLSVYAVDLRGRGQSDGERFYVEKFADYVDDVSAVVRLAKSREAGLPTFLLGHSAGGVLASSPASSAKASLTRFPRPILRWPSSRA